MDSEKNNRTEAIQKVESHYDQVMTTIWNGTDGQEEAREAEDLNPFVRASRRQMAAMGMTLPGQREIESLPSADSEQS